ncbi:eCIS core domain-containing protein [Vibrio quintilis]|uniref:eCIS core domain-containing protein n=1 Tax=Vibrio quintilis TaxID=1117707 RepID=A0A1M7Z2V2_9VIBR|nr:DUF4157 domain-containing protein [Vibrio quintilis]SHO59288.1 hypothetical protein VQ7734_05068 [Vibrio quintilis]
MYEQVEKPKENKNREVANSVAQKKSGAKQSFGFVDNRSGAITQRKLKEMTNNSPQVKQAYQLQAMVNSYSAQQKKPIQKKKNNTGLPDNLKSGIENLSGYSMDYVMVHYNSDKPAQLNAHAYAQGTDIHLASGQEKHLPHEAWHVVQQKQGRVKPTMQMKGKVNVNDDAGLEKEADVMGDKALQKIGNISLEEEEPTLQKNSLAPVVQRLIISLDPEDSTIAGAASTIKSLVHKTSSVTTIGKAILSNLKRDETLVILGHGERLTTTKEPNMAWDKEYDDSLEKAKRKLGKSHRPDTADLPIMTPEILLQELKAKGWNKEHRGEIDLRSCWSAMPSHRPNFITKFARLIHAEGRHNIVSGYKGPTETKNTTGEEKERDPFWYQLEEAQKLTGAMKTLIEEYFHKTSLQDTNMEEYKVEWLSKRREQDQEDIKSLEDMGFSIEIAQQAIEKKRETDWEKEVALKSETPELNFDRKILIQNRPWSILELIDERKKDFAKMKAQNLPMWNDEKKAFEAFEQAEKYIKLDEPVPIDKSPGKDTYKYIAQPDLLHPTTHNVLGSQKSEMEWKTSTNPLNLSMEGFHEV